MNQQYIIIIHMRVLTWLFCVLPFVTIVWFWDILSTLFMICCLKLHVTYMKYYQFAFNRSGYLQERRVVDAYIHQRPSDPVIYSPEWVDN